MSAAASLPLPTDFASAEQLSPAEIAGQIARLSFTTFVEEGTRFQIRLPRVIEKRVPPETGRDCLSADRRRGA